MLGHALAALVMFMLAAPARAIDESQRHAVGERGERLASAAEDAASMGFAGAVLAARDGRVIAALGVGDCSAGADPDAAAGCSPSTLFELASLTKQFTAAAILRLEEQGKLSLDDSIAEHLPGIPDDCAAITIEHLLRHTSGIPGSNAQGAGDDLALVLPSFLRGGPRHEPGSRFEYWNQGYALLSEIVARASGMAYVEYCRRELFAPAGMGATRFTGDPPPPGVSIAIGRSARGPSRSALEHPYGAYGFQYRGMGGAVSSVWDLWRWDRALRASSRGEDGAVLSPESVKKLFRVGQGGYALGWFVRRDTQRGVVHSHGGSVRGFVCEMRRYPDHDAVLIVLASRDDAPLRAVVGALEEILLDAAGARPGGERDGSVLRDLPGRYKDDRGRIIIIDRLGARLMARVLWGGDEQRGPVTRAAIIAGDDGPVMDDGSGTLHPVGIERDDAGAIAAITLLKASYRRQ